jgi:hypothetical protein
MRLPDLDAEQCRLVNRDGQVNTADHPNHLHGTGQ